MSKKKRTTDDQPKAMPSLSTTCPCDALARMQSVRKGPELFQPITYERAAELADIIAPYDDDAVIHALIELLHGIFEAAWHHKDPEGLVTVATYRAYSRTVHHSTGLKEFACLDPKNPRDRRVIQREFTDEDEADEADG